MLQPIYEHDIFNLDESLQKESFVGKASNEYMAPPVKLGITFVNSDHTQAQADYYIGADWLDDKCSIPCIVLPKLNTDSAKVDYIKLFAEALSSNNPQITEYFGKCYDISFTRPEIMSETASNILNPLILIHYISVLKDLAKIGLKKGYVTREENLNCKIKGNIRFFQNFNINTLNKREEKIFCRYQEFTEDIPENRLLKKALVFTYKAMLSMDSKSLISIKREINKLLAIFQNVSDDVSPWEVSKVSLNKIFKSYPQAIRLAKTILKRYGYDIENVEKSKNSTPPFWIDMPRLYEIYIFNTLNKLYPGQIKFQVPGHHKSAADYIKLGGNHSHNNEFVIDAKYKQKYDRGEENIEDMREISGYARDSSILRQLGYTTSEMFNAPVIPCIIIYPSALKDDGTSLPSDDDIKLDEEYLVQTGHAMNSYIRFYRLCIPVPQLP